MGSVLCITGMHRSGTSLVTAWLQQCGLVISDGRLLGAWRGNPRGHFEDLDLYRQQVAAVRALRPEAKGWQAFDTAPLMFPREQAAVLESLVAIRQAKYQVWAWKDPRSTLFLDEWARLVPGLTYFFIWRPCIEVVSSLARRGDRREKVPLLFFQAARIWLAYNRRLLAHLVQTPDRVVLLSLADVLRHADSVCSLLNSRFGLRLEYQPIDAVYEPTLLHDQPIFPARISQLYPGVRSLERQLAARATSIGR